MKCRVLLGLVACAVSYMSCGGPRPPRPTQAEYEAGKRYVDEKLQQAREGNVDLAFAAFLRIQTQLAFKNGNCQTAVHTAEPLAELIEIVHGPNSVQTAEALEMLSDIYCKVDRCRESPALRERAVRIRNAQIENPDGT